MLKNSQIFTDSDYEQTWIFCLCIKKQILKKKNCNSLCLTAFKKEEFVQILQIWEEEKVYYIQIEFMSFHWENLVTILLIWKKPFVLLLSSWSLATGQGSCLSSECWRKLRHSSWENGFGIRKWLWILVSISC
jgi:hypothetical protein